MSSGAFGAKTETDEVSEDALGVVCLTPGSEAGRTIRGADDRGREALLADEIEDLEDQRLAAVGILGGGKIGAGRAPARDDEPNQLRVVLDNQGGNDGGGKLELALVVFDLIALEDRMAARLGRGAG